MSYSDRFPVFKAAFACLALACLSNSAFAQVVITIPDPNLRAVIETELGKSPGDPITDTEMATITILNGYNSNPAIQDLTGLEYAVNLVDLTLNNNQISDVTPLTTLTNLQYLRLAYNQVTDITPLAGMANLIWLYLNYNQITDLAAVSGMTSLERLYVPGNQINDMPPNTGLAGLAGLSNLTHLFIENNQVTDLSPLSSIGSLTTFMAYNNRINDLKPIETMTVGFCNMNGNYLDISSGSDDRAIIDATGIDQYTSQKATMIDYTDWQAAHTLPNGDGYLDENGPLSLPNLVSYYMGIDSMTATADQMPVVEQDPANDIYRFVYQRDLKVRGLTVFIQYSTDMVIWAHPDDIDFRSPDKVNVLSDDGNGLQRVEALFEDVSDKLFFQLNVTSYVPEPAPIESTETAELLAEPLAEPVSTSYPVRGKSADVRQMH